MRDTESRVPVSVHTGWVDYSPQHRHYTSQQVRSQLAGFAHQIRSVTVRIDDESPSNVASRRCVIQVITAHAGLVSATAVGVDLFTVVDRALASVAQRLRDSANAQVHSEAARRVA